MVHTLFEYRYRDAGNFKAHGAVALIGSLADEELNGVRARFEADEFFIAEQLDIPPLYAQLYQWSDGPTCADHCWHEFVAVKTISDGEPPAHAVQLGPVRDFVDRLNDVRHWQGELSPHFSFGVWTNC